MLTTTQTPPSSQKAGERPISFVLTGRSDQDVREYPFVIRPEELTRVDASRVMVHQTLGVNHYGWVDSFGRGLPTINISGNTGWRIKQDGEDGIDRLISLKAQFDNWHEIRQEKINLGENPDDVRLLFVDTLDRFAVNVVPMQFVLKRSKSRPLLMQYNIAMVALGPDMDASPFLPAPATPNKLSIIEGLLSGINRITQWLKEITKWVDKTIVEPIKAFVALTKRMLDSVIGMIRTGVNLAARAIFVARDLAQAGMNIARTVSAILNLPDLAKQQVNRIATEFSSIFCLIKNALNITPYYDDYSSVYGASNCSSTAGGRPPSRYKDLNTFQEITAKPDTTVVVSGGAQESLTVLTRIDPVTVTMTPGELVAHTNAVVEGVAV